MAGRGRLSPRRPAYAPRLEVGVIANPIYLSRTKRRPAILRERQSSDRTTARALLDAYNSASFASQTQDGRYPGDNPDVEIIE